MYIVIILYYTHTHIHARTVVDKCRRRARILRSKDMPLNKICEIIEILRHLYCKLFIYSSILYLFICKFEKYITIL